ncbi:diphosphomevalonate decarboxylase [Carnobacteriaceae bacterium zg-ZUI78]|nr:diphosphomevalonate decarboxylase [Carnobacteriaceae bacterium zg-ZUI78]
MIGIARAHTNIALIKYWGKRDKKLFLPMNSSLSLTLDAFYTDTKVTFDQTLTKDTFFLNNKEETTEKITPFLDLFREKMSSPCFAKVESLNFVPTAAGLASSASAFAALAGAINQASGLHLDTQTLSTFARRGSGSATRSLYGGFVEWNKGTGSHNSMAIQIDDASWDIAMIIIVVSQAKKTISSRDGMALTVQTSPFYQAWVESAEKDLQNIKQAIANKDFITLGEITEFNGMKMHGTMLGSNPPFCYFEPETIIAQQAIRQLRAEGVPAYMTMDAGPNVKVLCQTSTIPTILSHLETLFSKDKLIISKVGKAMHPLTQNEWEQSLQSFEDTL